MHLVLIGLPGAGKTTVGRRLAARLARRFVDVDALVEQASGKTVGRIFAEDGEAAFRSAECEVSGRLAEGPPAVIAAGGGWALNSGAVAHLRGMSRIIYLRVPPAEALARMGRGVARRPILAAAGDPIEALRELELVRLPAYEELADAVVETAGTPRERVVARVLALASAWIYGDEPGVGAEPGVLRRHGGRG